MNNQFIQGVMFDWDKIDDDSYLKKIEAFKGIERLEFHNSITFSGANFLKHQELHITNVTHLMFYFSPKARLREIKTE